MSCREFARVKNTEIAGGWWENWVSETRVPFFIDETGGDKGPMQPLDLLNCGQI